MAYRPLRLSSLLVFSLTAACFNDVDPDLAGLYDETGVTLDVRAYDVLFTNPLCGEYKYAEAVTSVAGDELTAKPQNVYCSSDDAETSAARASSPQNKLLSWLEPLTEGDEVFLASLSFSNRATADALCAAAERGAQVTMVLDAETERSKQVAECGGTVLLRGHQGSIDFAHNKLVLINPNSKGPSDQGSKYMRLAFGSGNLSSGLVTHHENWHFLEVARKSYFVKSHVCMMNAQVDETASASKGAYRDSIENCRADIEAKEEDDIKAFFVPNSRDNRRANAVMIDTIADASEIDLAAHRFSHTKLVNALTDALAGGGLTLRMVADDDLYWVAPQAGSAQTLGPNVRAEATKVAQLADAGGDNFEIRYMETNHTQKQLHHNKYLVYRDSTGDAFALLTGAANLTTTGFADNFENIYFIKIPSVLSAFEDQVTRVWHGQMIDGDDQAPPVATPADAMPAELVSVE